MMHSNPAVKTLLAHELADWEERLVLLRVVLVLLVLLLATGLGFYIAQDTRKQPVYVVPGAVTAGTAAPASRN